MENPLVELGMRLAEYRRAANPADYGIAVNGVRRTPGLRREEVADLTSLSADLISKLERGKYPSVSARLLLQLSDFYRLDNAKRSDLINVARLEERRERIVLEREVPESMQRYLDHQREYPAYITNRRWDVIAWNEAMNLVLGDLGKMPEEKRNILWILYGSPAARELIVDWERHARRVMGQFRLDYGWARGDVRFEALVEELSSASTEFALWWSGTHDIRARQTIFKQIRHPVAGVLDFQQMGFRIEDNPNLQMSIYYPTTARTADLLRKLVDEYERSLIVTAADFPVLANRNR